MRKEHPDQHPKTKVRHGKYADKNGLRGLYDVVFEYKKEGP
jgi:uncharacterized short protein YbdD (DUF466 family)